MSSLKISTANINVEDENEGGGNVYRRVPVGLNCGQRRAGPGNAAQSRGLQLLTLTNSLPPIINTDIVVVINTPESGAVIYTDICCTRC